MKKYIIFLISLFIPFQILAYSNKVILGGENIGINIESDGILVVGFYKINNTYNNSKLKVGDYIKEVNGIKVNNINELISAIENNVEDSKVNITYKRNDKLYQTTLNLEKIDNTYKTGLYVKDSITGVGTLTYIDPGTKIYGALGHVIADSITNNKVEIRSGSIFKSDVTSIDRSVNMNPGTKNAKFYKNIIYGNIYKNETSGIYGNYNTNFSLEKEIEVLDIKDVKKGLAYIYTTLDDNTVKPYKINILKINTTSKVKIYILK